MSVIWVNILLTEGKPCAYIHTTEGLLIDNVPLSPLLLRTLCTDRLNRVAEGIGSFTPTPWGWFWDNSSEKGKLPEPPIIHYHQTVTQLLDAVFGSPTLRY